MPTIRTGLTMLLQSQCSLRAFPHTSAALHADHSKFPVFGNLIHLDGLMRAALLTETAVLAFVSVMNEEASFLVK